MELEEFAEQLRQPDHVTISKRLSKRLYMLTDDDLKELESVEQPNPYGKKDALELFWLTDIVRLAKEKHSEEVLVQNFVKHISPKASGAEAKRRIYGMIHGIDRWYTGPSSTSPEGKRSILQGLQSNLVIFGGKLLASKYTGSMALFADSMHSLADVCNYLYRYYSITHSQKMADQTHPYGYAPLRHICADRSFVGLLLVGGVIPVAAGLYELTEIYHFAGWPAPPEPSLVLLSGTVLLFSMFMEGLAMRAAQKEMGERAASKAPDIMSAATHLEAKAGVYGGLVGMVGVLTTLVTGNPTVEIVCATAMGGIVAGVACHLLGKSSTSLLGATLPVERVTQVIELLQKDDIVVEVFDVKTQVLGSDTVRFKAELHYNAEAITKRRRDLHELPSQEAQELYDELKSLNNPHAAEDWLMKNDAEFLIAFSTEAARLRALIRTELSEYTKVHVDLNVF
eukprot:TRINITY_DN10599_c0_g1_i2.p1 TRINITY_DN10599_c0_g1~~TRINITY_DN10599_c0_g1_i2.p1  ORF type:complete len:516 (+),score=228.49 TRINITY_DN10599_c0_g1_i2:188-1549(+)